MTTLEQIKAKGAITTSDEISFEKIVDVLNNIFNCKYRGYQRAAWVPKGSKYQKIVWFPKLSATNEKPIAREWDNRFFDPEKRFICERRILTGESEKRICEGNESHYNNPLDCIESGNLAPNLSPEMCKYDKLDYPINWHREIRATFAKVNDESYKFFGIYEFIGIQTVQYEKIRRNSNNPYTVKNKYIEVFKKINDELNISEWARV